MGLLMLFKGLPKGDDYDVTHVLVDPFVLMAIIGTHCALFRDETGILIDLSTNEAAVVVSIVILHHVAHLAQNQLDILNADTLLEVDNIEQHDTTKGDLYRMKHVTSPYYVIALFIEFRLFNCMDISKPITQLFTFQTTAACVNVVMNSTDEYTLERKQFFMAC
jgi:hypothetical protein